LSVVRPIARLSLCLLRRFFKQTRWTLHGRTTPDFEPSLVWSIGPLPAWHVERPRKSPKWLLAFVAAISCCRRERFLRVAQARMYARDRGMENRLNRLSCSATKCLHARTGRFTTRSTKERPYCLSRVSTTFAQRHDFISGAARPRLLVVLCHFRRKRHLDGLSFTELDTREREREREREIDCRRVP